MSFCFKKLGVIEHAFAMRKFSIHLVLGLCCAQLVNAQPNLVNNPGFEEPDGTNGLPTGGWWPFEGRGKATALVDSTVAHSGKNSLRITGSADAKFTVVSPKLEVSPGDDLHFEVWARAKDLPTNQSTITAGLGFRHKDKHVIQRNYFHLEKASADWTLISGDAKAPAQAVSAEVHLGYASGPGKVWFDDVNVRIMNQVSMALTEEPQKWIGPQEIAVKVTNRQKKEFRGSVSCNVGGAISTTPVVVPAESARTFKLEIKLNKAGQHHYKLNLLDTTETSARLLEGTFVTAPPMILFPACPCYQFVGQGDQTTRIDARLNVNPQHREGMKFKVEISSADGRSLQKTNVDASEGDYVGCNVKLPVQQEAVFNIRAALLADDGSEMAKDMTQVHVTASDQAKVTLGHDGFLRVDGHTEFPIGIYNCGSFEDMGKAGFNATHEYGVVTGPAEDPINPNERRVQELLDESWSHRLRAMIELPRSAIEKADWAQVVRRVETFRHHPGLLCWGSEERVARGEAPLENIAKLYRIVHELDPDHPLVLGDTRDVIQHLQVDRRNFFPDPDMDIGIWWWYPFPLKQPDGNGLEGGANSGQLLDPPNWLTTTLSKKPLWIAIQSYQKPSKDARFPTPEEYRAQAWLSVINGVKGLWFYIGYGQKDYQGKPAGLLNKPELSHWDYVQQLARELRDLTPVIASPNAPGKIKLSPTNAPVDFTMRESGGTIYLIAANKSLQPQKARFESALFEGRKAQVLYEQHAATVEGSSLTDDFQPFGVHIYEFKK